MATIREVAAVAGVSRSTVSLVLNDSPLVKAETREHVLSVIREMKYVPNNNARSLSNKIMNSLGVIILSEQGSDEPDGFKREPGLYSSGILAGISDGLADTDYSVVIERYNYKKSGGELPKLIRTRRVDGAFVIGSLYDREFIEKMKQSGIPFCVVGVGLTGTEYDVVWASPEEGVFLSVKHLMEEGHRNLCLVNCPETFISHEDRVRGIREAEDKLGLKFDWNMSVSTETNSGEGGYRAIQKLWEDGYRPDGIVTANAAIALGIMRYFHECGVRVPEDVSIVAYEDNALCCYAYPGLTAVNTQKKLCGIKAAQVMLDRLECADRPYSIVKVEPYLIKRSSVKTRNN